MDEYISREEAVDAGYLSDWYISSVGDESPVWTDEHIDELLNDFLVIPKDTPTADVQPVKYGRWEVNGDRFYPFCSNCKYKPPKELIRCNALSLEPTLTKYCPRCGSENDTRIYRGGDSE